MNPNNHVVFPLDIKPGLGMSPFSGPPQGGWGYTPGTQFYQMPLYSILPNGSTPTSNKHFFGTRSPLSPLRSPASPRRRSPRRETIFIIHRSPKKLKSKPWNAHSRPPRAKKSKYRNYEQYAREKKILTQMGRRFGYPLMNQPSSTIDMQMFPRYPVGDSNSSGGNSGVWLQGMPSFQQYWGFGTKKSLADWEYEKFLGELKRTKKRKSKKVNREYKDFLSELKTPRRKSRRSRKR